jgi:hypothetical protein
LFKERYLAGDLVVVTFPTERLFEALKNSEIIKEPEGDPHLIAFRRINEDEWELIYVDT